VDTRFIISYGDFPNTKFIEEEQNKEKERLSKFERKG
jgi:hypothetical protein